MKQFLLKQEGGAENGKSVLGALVLCFRNVFLRCGSRVYRRLMPIRGDCVLQSPLSTNHDRYGCALGEGIRWCVCGEL